MGKVVGGFWMPHDPVMLVAPEAPEKSISEAMWGAYRTCAERLAELDPTTVIIVGCDHYILFGPHCLPPYAIAVGDVDGPIEGLPGLTKGVVKNNQVLARQIVDHGSQNGFDWTVGRAFTVDHSFSIPHQYVVRPAEEKLGREISTVPVYLACGVDPYIPLKKAADLGKQIKAAVEAMDGNERVVVIGSGGISHWVGTSEMGKVSEDFDREILDHGIAGDLDGLTSYTDEEIKARAGNGAMEIRNFACAMGAVSSPRGEEIAYAAVPEWVTGLGFLQIHSEV